MDCTYLKENDSFHKAVVVVLVFLVLAEVVLVALCRHGNTHLVAVEMLLVSQSRSKSRTRSILI